MLTLIHYEKLTASQKAIYCFHKIASALVDYGYTCQQIAHNGQLADFIAYHIEDDELLKCQLKRRLSLNKKYLDTKRDRMGHRI